MNVLEIPFVKIVGIEKNSNGELELAFHEKIHNHLQTIHASAQFALAETASGECLLGLFPELEGKIIPVLRESKMKFRKPALKNIAAYPSVSEEAQAKFSEQFLTKGRALISVDVEVRDADETVTCTANYIWFLQLIAS